MNINKACLRTQGFTLLISVLVVSIMLGISMGIVSIIRGEIILSNTGKRSQAAFYAADAGMECAIYWDTINGGNPGSAFDVSVSSQLSCAGQSRSVGNQAISIFAISFNNGSCARVSVTKSINTDDPQNPIPEAFIHSDGFSEGTVNGNACTANEPRVFQRSLEVTTYGN